MIKSGVNISIKTNLFIPPIFPKVFMHLSNKIKKELNELALNTKSYATGIHHKNTIYQISKAKSSEYPLPKQTIEHIKQQNESIIPIYSTEYLCPTETDKEILNTTKSKCIILLNPDYKDYSNNRFIAVYTPESFPKRYKTFTQIANQSNVCTSALGGSLEEELSFTEQKMNLCFYANF